MSPVIKHLHALFPGLPDSVSSSLIWNFDKKIKELSPDFYHNVVLLHPILNMEYSILGHQLRHYFLFPQGVRRDHVIEQLVAALILCELLEHIHLHYLVVPREVLRLRKQKLIYRRLLRELQGYSFSSEVCFVEEVQVGFSLSHQIRTSTVEMNWYRILLGRSRRFLNLLDAVGTGSEGLHRFIVSVDKYANPILTHLGWSFHIPRLTTNLLLTIKHIIPGPWMEEEEKSLNWSTRLQAQIQRRWFELGNDIVWITIGLLNCFVCIGSLVSLAPYLTISGFAFDLVNVCSRASIELSRLSTLQEHYSGMLCCNISDDQKELLREHQHYMNHRIAFEKMRFALNIMGTTTILLAMCLAAPAFSLSPVILLVSAGFLLLLWTIMFALAQKLESVRPKDALELQSSVTGPGFFSSKKDKNKPVALSDCVDEASSPPSPVFI